jgi:hypothetical protein
MKAQLDALVAVAKVQRKTNAEKAVQAAVERGALKADDTAIAARSGSASSSRTTTHLERLASDAGKPTAQSVLVAADVTQRSAASRAGAQRRHRRCAQGLPRREGPQKAAGIYAAHISQVIRDPNFRIAPILAANALGSLAGNLVVQKALTLLKLDFPVLTAFSTDFTDAGAKFNQTVVVPHPCGSDVLELRRRHRLRAERRHGYRRVRHDEQPQGCLDQPHGQRSRVDRSRSVRRAG